MLSRGRVWKVETEQRSLTSRQPQQHTYILSLGTWRPRMMKEVWRASWRRHTQTRHSLRTRFIATYCRWEVRWWYRSGLWEQERNPRLGPLHGIVGVQTGCPGAIAAADVTVMISFLDVATFLALDFRMGLTHVSRTTSSNGSKQSGVYLLSELR